MLLHPDVYSQEFHYCPLSFKLDRGLASCNTLKGRLSARMT